VNGAIRFQAVFAVVSVSLVNEVNGCEMYFLSCLDEVVRVCLWQSVSFLYPILACPP